MLLLLISFICGVYGTYKRYDGCTYGFPEEGLQINLNGLYSEGITASTIIGILKVEAHVGICQQVKEGCNSETNNLIVAKGASYCMRGSVGSWDQTKPELTDNGIIIVYPPGDLHFQIPIELSCDPDADPYTVDFINIEKGTFRLFSKFACFQIYPSDFQRFLVAGKGRYVLAPILIAAGAFLLAFAIQQYMLASMIVISIGIAVVIAFSIYLIPITIPVWLGYIITFGAIIGGGICAFLFRKSQRLIKLIIGGIGGMVLALWLQILFLCYINEYTVYFAAVVLFATGLVVANFSFSYVYIFSTASLGSTLLLRGLSGFIGGYPHDLLFYEQYLRGKKKIEFPWTIYVYFACIIAVTAISWFYQRWRERKETDSARIHREDFFGVTSAPKEMFIETENLQRRSLSWPN